MLLRYRNPPSKVRKQERGVEETSITEFISGIGRELAKAAGKVVQAKPKGDEAKWVIEGTLTVIRAKGTLLGEGAYLTPNLGGWQGDFVCEVWADLEKFKETPKASFSSISRQGGEWTMSQNTTIIAARIPGQCRYTMRIPPHYLKPSPQRMMDILTGRKKPKVDLGISKLRTCQNFGSALVLGHPRIICDLSISSHDVGASLLLVAADIGHFASFSTLNFWDQWWALMNPPLGPFLLPTRFSPLLSSLPLILTTPSEATSPNPARTCAVC
ncbi:hypothetical protein F5877DRAFT_80825 [Lentinula edodes]|nr:hypothetical protein F5877DRAFT_80825 [Lentinula edodes]